MIPPSNSKILKNDKDTDYPSEYLSKNNYYEPWCDYLGPIVYDKSKGFYYQYDNILVIVCRIDESYCNAFR